MANALNISGNYFSDACAWATHITGCEVTLEPTWQTMTRIAERARAIADALDGIPRDRALATMRAHVDPDQPSYALLYGAVCLELYGRL